MAPNKYAIKIYFLTIIFIWYHKNHCWPGQTTDVHASKENVPRNFHPNSKKVPTHIGVPTRENAVLTALANIWIENGREMTRLMEHHCNNLVRLCLEVEPQHPQPCPRLGALSLSQALQFLGPPEVVAKHTCLSSPCRPVTTDDSSVKTKKRLTTHIQCSSATDLCKQAPSLHTSKKDSSSSSCQLQPSISSQFSNSQGLDDDDLQARDTMYEGFRYYLL